MRPVSAAALNAAEAPSRSEGSVSPPTTRTCLSSVVTDGAPVNHPSGSLPANQPAIFSSSALFMITRLHPCGVDHSRLWQIGSRSVHVEHLLEALTPEQGADLVAQRAAVVLEDDALAGPQGPRRAT